MTKLVSIMWRQELDTYDPSFKVPDAASGYLRQVEEFFDRENLFRCVDCAERLGKQGGSGYHGGQREPMVAGLAAVDRTVNKVMFGLDDGMPNRTSRLGQAELAKMVNSANDMGNKIDEEAKHEEAVRLKEHLQ